eukprot:4935905-Alexandrium_andersonii.AAC.1
MVDHSAYKKAAATTPALRIAEGRREGQELTPETLELSRSHGKFFDWNVSDSTAKPMKGDH